ncbi:MAG: prepilin-type N-terminal cleavage/methylation domain-containing protein [Rickettsiales bacterium]|nr:prepilin-type N-terminal cleavage/methylation domain-containing protein [Pseudomonadota bacterium]MDA0966164.1 prepilin-type N-terminal cleavage/methylation domain-containing protein [Pseudomonadota bacterium]MDG4543171.1 prepilin-type N-terminal cleavage/methylation domain-containing protein [Rickettsiales bacterium]MDG4545369.1 prepilin-type N-terminal cleavage/methylation domain-containing protein [Rickettsiales bacterium]MDG4547818.1 prepilin-type N-terminal cleavage/methylation domain-c
MPLLFKNNLALNKQKGFSLVELSVVVAIIGVIVAAVIGVKQIYDSAKIRRISTEITSYVSSINTFKQEYGYWPGDLPQAVAFWTATPKSGVNITNGNGDNVITLDVWQNNEDLYSWAHLSGSELIPERTYSGLVSDAGVTHYNAGVNIPISVAFKNMVFSFFSFIVTEDNYIYKEIGGVKLRVSGLDNVGRPWNNANSLAAKQVQAIDVKIDDGKADSGNLITHTDVGGSCTTAPYNAPAASYNLSSTAKDCIMEFYLDRF